MRIKEIQTQCVEGKDFAKYETRDYSLYQDVL